MKRKTKENFERFMLSIATADRDVSCYLEQEIEHKAKEEMSKKTEKNFSKENDELKQQIK